MIYRDHLVSVPLHAAVCSTGASAMHGPHRVYLREGVYLSLCGDEKHARSVDVLASGILALWCVGMLTLRISRGGDSCWCQHAATHACGSMHRDAAEHGNLQQRNAQHHQGIQDISGRRGHQAQQVQDPGEHLERRGLARRAGGAKIYLGTKISHLRY
jgi:hypothetical protein